MTWLNPRVFRHDERRVGLEWDCPKTRIRCMVPFTTWPIPGHRWKWDGDEKQPTVTPSINCTSCKLHVNCVKGSFVATPDSPFKP